MVLDLPAGNCTCTDYSHLNLPKGKLCEPSADWQNLGAQSWWKRSNIKTTTKLISVLWILLVMETASLYHAFPNWKICIHTMLRLAQKWLWGMDWNRFHLFFVLSTTHINQCTAFFFPIITLIMFIFMIVYSIDNARHLFSIVWIVLSIILDMIPPIFPPV